MLRCSCEQRSSILIEKRQDFTFSTILSQPFGKPQLPASFRLAEGYVCENVVGPTAVTEATNIPLVKSLPVILYSY